MPSAFLLRVSCQELMPDIKWILILFHSCDRQSFEGINEKKYFTVYLSLLRERNAFLIIRGNVCWEIRIIDQS